MTAYRLLLRIVISLLSLCCVCAVATAFLLAFPQPLYAYHLERGRLSLYSDEAFDMQRAKALLSDVERRIDAAPAALREPDANFNIFVTNQPWRQRLVFLWNTGAAGLNYNLGTHAVFIRRSDVDGDRMLARDGEPVSPPRTLAYYAAHEIGHSLIVDHIGHWRNWRLARWQREGMADFIGRASDLDVPASAARMRAGSPDLDPLTSGNYERYALLCGFLIRDEHWPVDDVLKRGLSQASVEGLMAARASDL